MPPSNGDPSGPVIWARILVMSAGLGAKAATPGGGSLANNDISRIKRAAHVGEMLLLMVVLNSSSSDQAMPMLIVDCGCGLAAAAAAMAAPST